MLVRKEVHGRVFSFATAETIRLVESVHKP